MQKRSKLVVVGFTLARPDKPHESFACEGFSRSGFRFPGIGHRGLFGILWGLWGLGFQGAGFGIKAFVQGRFRVAGEAELFDLQYVLPFNMCCLALSG